MNLAHHLEARADECPVRDAIRDVSRGEPRAITYGELRSRVAAAAAAWKREGLKPGDAVVILHPVAIEFYEVLLLLWHAGLVAVIVDPSRGAAFVNRACRRIRPAALVVSPAAGWLRLAFRELRRIRHVRRLDGWCPAARPWRNGGSPAEIEPVNADHPALITFTSGGTGEPKVAVRTHGFLVAQHHALAESLDLRDGEIDLVTLPVFAVANLASGLTSVIADTDLSHPGRAHPERIRNQVSRERVTRCAASPAFFSALLTGGEFPAFASIFTGGAPVFPDLLKALGRIRPDMCVHSVYGSTEAEPIAHIEMGRITDEVWREMTAGGGLMVGEPVPEIHLAIISDRHAEHITELTENEFQALQCHRGEVVVSGDHVLPGYLGGRGDEQTKIRVEDRIWHRTGDAGRLDELGRLWLLGRCSAGVEAEGHRWYPYEIEARVCGHAGIRRSAFVLSNAGPILLVEPRPGHRPDPDELLKELEDTPVVGIRMIKRLPVDGRHEAKIDYGRAQQLADR